MPDGRSSPATHLAAVTPSDSTVVRCKALYVGGAGDLALQARDDSTTVTLVGVTAGSVIPVSCNKVMAATTATNIVALF